MFPILFAQNSLTDQKKNTSHICLRISPRKTAWRTPLLVLGKYQSISSTKRILAGMTTMPMEESLIYPNEVIDAAEIPSKERKSDLSLRRQIVELASIKEMHAISIRVSVPTSLGLKRLKL
jgi:hypothetical protein